ncbi:uncharacterized protein DEA37_0008794, partial [Paragonimus westermani]
MKSRNGIFQFQGRRRCSVCMHQFDFLEPYFAPATPPHAMPSIKFASSDGEIFDVDVAIARQSVLIKTMLD